ncbi:hypothetical protein ABGB12_03585 [Actinocorallia sp. B10E7]|uniref:hypothetical protein n=1 Tax=Actinocorallia sp. B10E7 TaxID=3153558 RepID=UPI00325F358D
MLTSLILGPVLFAPPEPQPVEPRCEIAATVTCLQTLSGGRPAQSRYPRQADSYVLVRCPEESRFCVTTLIAAPKVSTAEVARMAQARLEMPLPVPRTRPSPTSYVGLRTFLWLEPDLWKVYQAKADAAGQRVVLTGRPLRVRWDLGDGQEVCVGSSGPDGPCSHVWTRSSPEPYTVTATVEYEVSWKCEGDCDAPSGTLPVLEVSGHTRVIVREIQTSVHAPG